jgi:hypothetical protein
LSWITISGIKKEREGFMENVVIEGSDEKRKELWKNLLATCDKALALDVCCEDLSDLLTFVYRAKENDVWENIAKTIEKVG